MSIRRIRDLVFMIYVCGFFMRVCICVEEMVLDWAGSGGFDGEILFWWKLHCEIVISCEMVYELLKNGWEDITRHGPSSLKVQDSSLKNGFIQGVEVAILLSYV